MVCTAGGPFLVALFATRVGCGVPQAASFDGSKHIACMLKQNRDLPVVLC